MAAVLMISSVPANGQEPGKFDVMIDYQAFNVSNVSVHPGAFLHFSPVVSKYRLDIVIGADVSLDNGGTNEATLFYKTGGYMNEGNSSYLFLGASVNETQPVYVGLEHQYRLFSRQHFSCHVNAQLFMPVPAMDVTYEAMRFASFGVLLRVY
jgi:hypothetical protein